jgi:hypothetical protein
MRLLPKAFQQTYFQAFAARARSGVFGQAVQVGSQTVEKAIRHVAQTLCLAGYDDPRRSYGNTELDIPFRHLLESYSTQDPAPQPQLAITVATIERAGAFHQAPNLPRVWATADLVTIAFFFLLRVGGYTMPAASHSARTVQSRTRDVTFRDAAGNIVPHTSSLLALSQAATVTLWFDNQKNGQPGVTIHHTTCPS